MKYVNYTFLALGMLLSIGAVAQSNPDKQAIEQLASEKSIEFHTEKENAITWALERGYPLRFKTEAGNTIELIRLSNGLPIYYSTLNAEGAAVIKTDRLYPGAGNGFSLTGDGIIMGIWDAGTARSSHQEFAVGDESKIYYGDDSEWDNHGTHVAATMVAVGTDPAARGMSYEAELVSFDWNDNTKEMLLATYQGIRVSQHSYGALIGWEFGNFSGNEGWHFFGDPDDPLSPEAPGFGLYENGAFELDALAHAIPKHLIVKSAGNSRGGGPTNQPVLHWVATVEHGFVADSTTIRPKNGGDLGYDCIPTGAIAKNILVVGAVKADGEMSAFSSWGPSDDGRIKPDIVAKGVNVFSALANADDGYASWNGTSMSGPMVSGSVGLLLQHQQNLHPDEELLAATMKAILLHTADDIGPEGPDYQNGWGMMNTEKAALLMQANAEQGGIHIMESSLNQYDTLRFVVKTKGDEPLKATLVWTDIPGEPTEFLKNTDELKLVNDLDMRIQANDQMTHYPFILDPANPTDLATTGDNFRDNVERTDILQPQPEAFYTITISHKGMLTGTNQQFSLVVSGNESFGFANLNESKGIAVSNVWSNKGNVFIDAPALNGETVTIQLFDTQGRILIEQQLLLSGTVSIPVSNHQGFAILRIVHNSNTSVHKLLLGND